MYHHLSLKDIFNHNSNGFLLLCNMIPPNPSSHYFSSPLERKPRQLYSVDFACYKPNDSCAITKEETVEALKSIGVFSKENLKRMEKIVAKSSLGRKTYLPQAIKQKEPKLCLVDARKET